MQTIQPESLASYLKLYRSRSALSQEELAERSGVSARTISDLERGLRNSPHLHTVRELAMALDLSPQERELLVRAARSLIPSGAEGEHNQPKAFQFDIRQAPLTRLFGRSRDVEEVLSLLEEHQTRLLTLTGPGGVGKTRLAAAVATEWPTELISVNLAPVLAPKSVLASIAQSLNAPAGSGADDFERVVRAIGDRPALLVLDNFEHVASAADFVDGLLQKLPYLTVMVTSRVRLNLRGERVYQVQPLPVAPESASPVHLSESPAVQLFIDRAQAANQGLSFEPDDLRKIGLICIRLDGLPLAIELAAARLRIYPLDQLITHLDPMLPMLTGGARDLPERQKTMLNTIDWSYKLLDATNQRLLRWLSVYVNGYPIEAAEHAFAVLDPASGDFEGNLGSLIDSGLVRPVLAANESRFRMFEMVREFAQQELRDLDEMHLARLCHAEWALRFIDSVGPEDRRHDNPNWQSSNAMNIEDLALAFEFFEGERRADDAMKVAFHCAIFWYATGPWHRGLDILRRAIAIPGPRTESLVAECLELGAIFLIFDRRSDEARDLVDQSLKIRASLDLADGIAEPIRLYGLIEEQQCHWDAARPFLEQSIVIFRTTGNKQRLADTLGLLAGVMSGLGDPTAARRYAEETRDLRIELGGSSRLDEIEWYLGKFSLAEGAYLEALGHFRESLSLHLATGMVYFKPLSGLAALAAVAGCNEASACFLGAVDSELDRTQMTLFPFDQEHYDLAQASAIESLGINVFERERERGRCLSSNDWFELTDQLERVLSPVLPG